MTLTGAAFPSPDRAPNPIEGPFEEGIEGATGAFGKVGAFGVEETAGAEGATGGARRAGAGGAAAGLGLRGTSCRYYRDKQKSVNEDFARVIEKENLHSMAPILRSILF